MESVGSIPKGFSFSGSGGAIAHFRHALALDERRVKFIPSLYGQLYHPNQPPCDVKSEVDDIDVIATDVQEVFFAGAHCGTRPAFKRAADTLLMSVLSDVGGGSVVNGQPHSLARIPLRWMIRECFKLKTGIIFDAHMLKHRVGLDIDSDTVIEAPQPVLSPTNHLTKDGPTEELKDALSPIYDQLEKRTFWRVMEWIPCEPSSSLKPFAPMTTSSKPSGRKTPSWMIQMPYGAPRSCRFSPFVVYRRRCAMSLIMLTVSWNRGKSRIVVMKHGVKPKVHRSVKTRMLAKGPGGELYRPKARFIIYGTARGLTREEWLAEEPEHFEWVD